MRSLILAGVFASLVTSASAQIFCGPIDVRLQVHSGPVLSEVLIMKREVLDSVEGDEKLGRSPDLRDVEIIMKDNLDAARRTGLVGSYKLEVKRGGSEPNSFSVPFMIQTRKGVIDGRITYDRGYCGLTYH